MTKADWIFLIEVILAAASGVVIYAVGQWLGGQL